MLRYSDKVFNLRAQISAISDCRLRPRCETATTVSGILVMALAQLGSLNALEQTAKGNGFRRGWIGYDLPSADTVGNIAEKIDVDSVRSLLKHVYARLKRNKALQPFTGDKFVLVIDGHESSSSYVMNCEGCLKRVIHLPSNDRTQYYHRHVMAQLVCGNVCLPLDMEVQRPGEDEVAAAMRLLKRMLKAYPRAFSLIVTDGLYLRAPFFELVLQHGKEVIAVLKDERRDLLKDAHGLFKSEAPVVYEDEKVKRECWDIEHFTSWPQLGREVRVVRSIETTRKKKGTEISTWIWAGTISKEKLSTEQFVAIAHGRWKIENNGFNELVNYWHADHVYRHDPIAIEVFWLLTMLAYMLFHAFIGRNLKPVIRQGYSKLHWSRMITAGLYSELCCVGIPP